MLEVPDNLGHLARTLSNPLSLRETVTVLCRLWAVQGRSSNGSSLVAATMSRCDMFASPLFPICLHHPENGQRMPQRSVTPLFYSISANDCKVHSLSIKCAVMPK